MPVSSELNRHPVDGTVLLDPQRSIGFVLVLFACVFAFPAATAKRVVAQGEPAQAFLDQLRSQGYYDMAVIYLDRLNQYPGVDPELLAAASLEKAQTYIDAAVASTDADKRDRNFRDAETQLRQFTRQGSHPRIAEARSQLGRLQMVRASQLMASDPTDAQRDAARESYLEAAKTFDAIVDELTIKLKDIQGQKIDASKDPEAAQRRDRYRAEFLQAKFDAAETRRLAAETFKDPASDGKALLQKSTELFTDLYDNYGQKYPIGANALFYTGRCQELLGNNKDALDRFMLMLDQVDADPLREAKFQALSGAIRLWLKQSPPDYQQGIKLGEEMLRSVRRNEQSLASVQELRVHVAKAYLAKANDGGQSGPDKNNAQSEGRKLLVNASKVPGPHLAEAKSLMADLGVEDTKVELPKAEPPKSLDDAVEKARQLLSATESLRQSLSVLSSEPNPSKEVQDQINEITKQLAESSGIGIVILRGGLAMMTRNSDFEKVNEARQLLTYILYQEKRYRDAAVVGRFLARTSPGTEVGLRGGLLALNSLQLLLAEVPTDANAGLIDQVDALGKFLTKTWPNNPDARAAEGVMIRLALSKDRFDEAESLINQMAEGPEQAKFRRLLGQLLYNASVLAGRDGDRENAQQLLNRAGEQLSLGLEAAESGRVDGEAMQAALVLGKIYLKQDNAAAAIKVLDHPVYGPIGLMKSLGPPTESFGGDLYGTELQVLVQLMISADQDTAKLLGRATDTMENLRKSFAGPDGQKRLSATYMRMAGSIRDQLDSAPPAKREKLIGAFRVFLDRIAKTTKNPDTLSWVGQTLMQMGESAMLPTDSKATGQAAELIQSAASTFESLLQGNQEKPLALQYQLARCYRLLGQYKKAIDTLATILEAKPMMLDAQSEAALAYEKWAAEVAPKYASNAYSTALSGGRRGADGKNVIWGWGKISQLTSGKEQFRDKFFDARYHVASCRYLMGKAMGSNEVMQKAVSDITKVASLYPELGGPEQRKKFDVLMKEIQRALGQQATGLAATPPQ
tara:strand:- start:88273 stop:91353 length:3081 start_codon:yes stop_codon:yes gene_type:complete